MGVTPNTHVNTSRWLGNVRLWDGAKMRGLNGVLGVPCLSASPTLKLKSDTRRHLGVLKTGG